LSNAFYNQKHVQLKRKYNQEEERLSIVIPQIQNLIAELELEEIPFLNNLIAQV
jgi:hypothetical protein